MSAINPNLAALSEAGVALWIDDISRSRLRTGNLDDLRRGRSIVGVTSNPTIFQKALSVGNEYDEQLEEMAARKVTVPEAVRELTTYDIRWACDVLDGTWESTNGLDGRVSIEVDPRLAHDTFPTIAEAKVLSWMVDRPNVMIKIPATQAGLPAITATLAAGISVNVTLIFSLQRYQEVIDAFMSGLEMAKNAGHDLSEIGSVASFFVSRVDSEVDTRLDKIATDEAQNLKGRAAIANARLAYQTYESAFSSARWQTLADAGARPQRPLWASTGVKSEEYSDVMYVEQLIAPGCVNTLPEATMEAFADHGEVQPDTITGHYDDAQAVFDGLSAVGIDFEDVTSVLETQGVEKFIASWEELLADVDAALER